MSDIFDLIRVSKLPQTDHINPWDVVIVLQDGEVRIAAVEKVPGAAGSVEISTGSSGVSYIIPAKVLFVNFAIKSNVDGAFSLTTTPGDATEFENETLEANVWFYAGRMIFGGDTGQTIFFENLTGSVVIKLFLLG